MRRLWILLACLCFLRHPAASVENQSQPPSDSRPIWQWTDAEHFSARFHPETVRARRERALVSGEGGETIVGREHPEQLLPQELFGWLIFQGFNVNPSVRVSFRAEVESRVPLDPKFWDQLAAAASPYVTSIQQQQAAASPLNDDKKNLTAAERARIVSNLNLLQGDAHETCEKAARALSLSRRVVGGALFNQILYQGVAPGFFLWSDQPDSEQRAKWVEGGCK
jgi:hypothetical protein